MTSIVLTLKTFSSLKLADWPEADRLLIQKTRTPKTFLRPGGATSEWREKTLETVIYRNGVYLWWLGETGRLVPGSTPIERVTPENVEAFIDEYRAGHASTSLAGTLHGVYEATRVMHPEADLSYLQDAVAGVKAIAKPRPKLPRMADHGALVELGEALIAHGTNRVGEGHMLSAAAVRDGCMILFQIACPLRRTSFEGLRLGHSLLRDELGYRVALGPRQMKTGHAFEAPLPAWLAPHLELYIDVAAGPTGALGRAGRGLGVARRGRRAHDGKIHLPPRASIDHETPRSRNVASTSSATQRTQRSLSHDSARVRITGGVLGHTRHETSEKHYNQARGVEAVRRYHGLLKEQSRGAR
jgi:integrase/recombinase XerD